MIEAELDALDRAIEARGLAIWIGSEPTFTDASSLAPEWNGAAMGDAKEAKARALAARIGRARPHAMLLRCVGRQYGGEERPRWAYGIWERRDGSPAWSGPRDPLVADVIATEVEARARCEAARDAIASLLASEGWGVAMFETERDLRIAARIDGTMPDPEDERLLAPSPHDVKTPDAGLVDPLAEDRTWLVRMRAESVLGGWTVRLELPELGDVAGFFAALALTARALEPLELPSLILAGYPPASDSEIAFATITPDPAVIEVNTAPSASSRAFFEDARWWHALAQEEGLAPRRLFYDGEVGDSGGGGQLTIGGPSIDASPFFVEPRLLPRLVAYLHRHPSLSYLFAVDNVGPWSQSPRADEGIRASFEELRLTMHRLARAEGPLDRAHVQAAIGPFLRDATGNAHRAEINVEKLWNEDLPRRGKLGLVELRAFRMARSPERAGALGALWRGLIAYLATNDVPLTLPDHGDDLRDRWALPHHLARDLSEVVGDVARAGFPLGPAIVRELFDHDERRLGTVEIRGATLTVMRAIEPWPLVGDAGSQEQRSARWIDASTRRLEITIIDSPEQSSETRLVIGGVVAPLASVSRNQGEGARLAAVRFRAFVPNRGLHPGLASHAPLTIHWISSGQAFAITLHDWKPDGGAYDGLPSDDDEARARRRARFVVREIDPRDVVAAPAPQAAVRGAVLDLRWL